ncbi:MAG TPA: T9SS type A sorting domain-containing protein, partial [Bacteroidales bacterium]|nr:T9SS type A sorting domain-containing protein [Bacteroidales bacterium]
QYTNIYSNNLGTFNSIAHVPYSSESFYNIAHYTPTQTDNQFAISTVDICNQESELSTPHTALFLQIENADNNQTKLTWTPYIGADVNAYKIFAGNTPDNLIEITELTPDITTYIGEFDSYSLLCVVAILTQKIESKNNTYDAIRSNYVDTHTKIASIQNTAYIFPNPCANYITLNAPNPIINIQLQTIQGVQIYCFESIEMPFYISTQNLVPGVYILKITYKNNTSEVVHFIKE